jgi:hypothetical protein
MLVQPVSQIGVLEPGVPEEPIQCFSVPSSDECFDIRRDIEEGELKRLQQVLGGCRRIEVDPTTIWGNPFIVGRNKPLLRGRNVEVR